MFGFGKKKKAKVEEDYKIDSLKGASSNKIRVKIYKSMGGSVSFLKAVYEATEKRDVYGELVSINEETKHLEDVDFQMDSVYTELQVLLNLNNKDKKEKVEYLQKKIRKQERLIFYLNKLVSLNALFNYQDELARLRDYKVLQNHIKHHDENGAYFTIENGIREYCFESIDGFLIPIWRGVDTYSSFPDHTRNKKIKIQTDLRFQKELAQMKVDNKVMSAGLLFFAINMVVFAIVMFGGYQLWNKNAQLEEQFSEQALLCLEQTSKINTLYGGIVQEVLQEQRQEEQETTEKTTPDGIDDLRPES